VGDVAARVLPGDRSVDAELGEQPVVGAIRRLREASLWVIYIYIYIYIFIYLFIYISIYIYIYIYIYMIKLIRTSRLSIKNSLCSRGHPPPGGNVLKAHRLVYHSA